jgi:two-component system sensor histidine kinase BarA
LPPFSDFALYSKIIQLLSATAQSAMRLPDVAGVAYLDKDDKLLLGAGTVPAPTPPTVGGIKDFSSQDGNLYFKKPIYLSGIEFNDYQQESPNSISNTELIGWVIVVIDHASLREKQQEVIVTSLWLTLAGFIIAIALTYLLSLKLIAPIRQLTTTIKKMAHGRLDVRAETGTRDELAILANGINQLAESVTEGRVNLEDRIRVATYKLEETLADLQKKNLELETARHDAETANLSKSDFLARMSHELRTPITSIQGFIRLMKAARLPETDQHYCHIIDQAAQQLLAQIDDILAFSKLQSNTVELTQRPIDLAECTEQVVVLFSLQAQYKGLDLVVDYAPDLPLHRIGDSVRIQQILSNLIANAIKFCDEGGVYIHLKSDKQSNVIIEVMDTGIGIQKEAQDQLFNAFSQADTSISRLYGGTGLGLSILKNLVDLMGG